MPKRVFKYATGEPIPEGAVYCGTVPQTRVLELRDRDPYPMWHECWFVWHYFLVDSDA